MPKIVFVNDKYETYDDLWDSKPDIDGYEWVRYEKDYDVDDSTWASSNLTEAEQPTFYISAIPGVVIWVPEYTYDGVDETGDITLTKAAQWVATGWYHLWEGTEAAEPYDWNDLKPKIEYIINRT